MTHEIDPRCHEKVTLALQLFDRLFKDSQNKITPAWAYATSCKLAGITGGHAENVFASKAIEYIIEKGL